ncbi:hypothetical protein F4680DRAFT_464645 [Xylaria scruposa]|nr:hypothetical protein F4680DRAFT_464645 [Xylaria scruposa]
MKYVSEYSDRLEKANKRVKYLESERSRLLNENAALRAIKAPTRASPTAKSTRSSISNDTKHYTQATVSSRCKSKSMPLQESNNNDKAPRAIVINGKRHIYAAGVPTLMTTMDDWTECPRYMGNTKASNNRMSKLLEERMERRNRVDLRRLKAPVKPKSPDLNSIWSGPSWGTTLVEEDKLCSEQPQWESSPSSMPAETALSTTDTEVGNPSEQSLAQKSRLDDRLNLGDEVVYIDTRSGLKYLREAFEITQHAILDVKKCMPEWRSWMSEDDPNLVRLGRDEMISWMGSFEYSGRFHNGRPCRYIYYDLLRLPPLRNTICHPRGCELRDPENLDNLLQNAQKVSVVLGDEKRAQAIRGIRDALRTEVDMCVQEIKDVHDLASLPYYEAEYKTHHLKMFERILQYESYDGCKTTLAVAQAWQQRGTA